MASWSQANLTSKLVVLILPLRLLLYGVKSPSPPLCSATKLLHRGSLSLTTIFTCAYSSPTRSASTDPQIIAPPMNHDYFVAVLDHSKLLHRRIKSEPP
ncbi:hypothetical protein Bca4012_065526 [Brassica carinata]|uniref:Uncharacterized protein n=1 Tax=Brassica carinata TaxID=52824 RepID=A0A8X8AXT6_BRACI|nr:hypothetical protein Bca52824_017844 [Brassica carinata]